MKRLIVALFLAVMEVSGIGAAARPALAASLCVGSGPGCFSTIQAALNAAQNGDMIRIGPGTFAGPISIAKSVTIIGAGAGATIIKGGGNGPVVTIGTFLGSSQPSVSIVSVTITGGTNTTVLTPFTAQGGGVTVPPAAAGSAQATVTITNGVITGNKAEPSASQSCGPGCTFSAAVGGGIVNYGAMTLTATTVSNNAASIGTAVSGMNLFAVGGGVGNAGTLTIHGGSITGNTAHVSTATAPNPTGTGGGINNQGTLTIDGSTISNNSVTTSTTSADPTSNIFTAGGGVFNEGRATIRSTQILGNRATMTVYGGSTGCAGGGIDDEGSLILQNSILRDNHVSTTVTSPLTTPLALATGGGIDVDGSATITNTALKDNSSSTTTPAVSFSCCFTGTFALGGGLSVGGGDHGPATVTMTDSPVTGNRAVATSTSGTATALGGGVSNHGILTLRSTTVSDNTAQANGPRSDSFAGGGGIWNDNPSGPPAAQLTLIDSTIAHNTAEGSPGVTVQGGGLDNGTSDGATVTATDTLIAQNTPDNCYPPNTIPGCSL